MVMKGKLKYENTYDKGKPEKIINNNNSISRLLNVYVIMNKNNEKSYWIRRKNKK